MTNTEIEILIEAIAKDYTIFYNLAGEYVTLKSIGTVHNEEGPIAWGQSFQGYIALWNCAAEDFFISVPMILNEHSLKISKFKGRSYADSRSV